MKDKVKIVLGSLVLILALLSLFFGVKYYQLKDLADGYNIQNQELTVEHDSLMIEYENLQTEFAEIEAANEVLYSQLNEQDADLKAKQAQIGQLLRKDGVTKSDLNKAKRLIEELKTDKQNLLAQLQRLGEENDSLKVQNKNYSKTLTAVTQEKRSLEEQNSNLQVAKQSVETEKTALEQEKRANASKVAFSQVVPVKNIIAEGVKYKNSGKESTTKNYKRIDKLSISFVTEINPVAEPGDKEYIVRVIYPDGTMVYDTQRGSGTFESSENEGMKYTAKTYVGYENKEKNVTLFWRQDAPYQKGEYKVEVYQKGYKVGESMFELKGGL